MRSIASYRPDWVELVGIVGTVISASFYLWMHEFNWRAFVIVPAVIIFGMTSGYMLYDLWVPPRRK